MEKKLYRSYDNKMVAGVSAGIADYFELDPVIIRAAFILCTIGGGIGILAYILLWIIVPIDNRVKVNNKSENEMISDDMKKEEWKEIYLKRRQSRHSILGISIIVIGFLWLADNLIPQFDVSRFWPVTLILLGLFILARSRQHNYRQGESQ